MYMYRSALRMTRIRYLFTQNFRPLRIVRSSTSIRISPTNRLEITDPHLANLHFSLDPEGKQIVDLNFASEALGMPAADGYGWAQLEFGDQMGEGGRYTIVRKLGWGSHSSTWLARDSTDNKFVAVKVLTGYMTDMYDRTLIWEPEAFRIVSYPSTSPYCTLLLDEFTIPGKGSAGSHMCFVMPVYGGDVKALIDAQTTALPLPLARRIALHLLRGIVHAHERKVMHTDLKLNNVFFSTTMTTDQIEAWIMENPSRRHAPEASLDGEVQAAVSQPLPMISEEEAMRATYLLADFGCAQHSGLHCSRTMATPPVRPPEVYLEAEWDKPADIWTFGCLIFELVTSNFLFRYQPHEKFGLDETESMLYQMMMLTGEDFRAAQLQVSPGAAKYFTSTCQLKKGPTAFLWPIKMRLNDLRVVSEEEATAVVSLIERCLRLDPAHRPTAAELLSDRWFDGVE